MRTVEHLYFLQKLFAHYQSINDAESAIKVAQVLGKFYTRRRGFNREAYYDQVVRILPDEHFLRFSQKILSYSQTKFKIKVITQMVNFQILQGNYREAYEQLSSYLLQYPKEQSLFGIAALLAYFLCRDDRRWEAICNSYFEKYFSLGPLTDHDMVQYYYLQFVQWIEGMDEEDPQIEEQPPSI